MAVELITFIGVLSIILALELVAGFYFVSKGNQRKISEVEEENSKKNGLLCRFVLDGLGRKIGESVAIEEDIIIIKSGEKYLGVPLKHIEEQEKTLLVKGLVEQDKAELMGEKWRKESFRDMDLDDVPVGKEDGF